MTRMNALSTIFILTVFLFGAVPGGFCQDKATYKQEKPELAKILIRDGNDLSILEETDIDIITVKERFVVVFITKSEKQEIMSKGIVIEKASEKDLVKRIVKIKYETLEELKTINELKIDIWETQKKYVIAHVFDKHIRVLRKQNFSVEIL